MNLNEIKKWLDARADMRSRLDVNDVDHYRYIFANGDSYDHRDYFTPDAISKREVVIAINGLVVNRSRYTWGNFKWEIEEEPK